MELTTDLTNLALGALALGPAPAQAPPDSLVFPEDLDAWRRWEASHHRLRRAKGAMAEALRPTAPPVPDDVLVTRGPRPTVLVVVDAPTSTQGAALVAPLDHLDDVAVACPRSVVEHLPGPPERWTTTALTSAAVAARLTAVHTVLAAGSYLPLGAGAHRWARRHGARFVVVQHGLLTPFMAPLPAGAHLLAWSEADAAFWASGRTDITHEVIGSQLMWRAAQEGRLAPSTVAAGARPTFLGQLHGVELARSYMERVSREFCLMTGARYRPHPSEKDKLSRLTHALWHQAGITIDPGTTPLFATGSPVVSVFSTGVLEAAARGIPAWAHSPGAPDWVDAFHNRYTMARWEQDSATSTPPPAIPEVEPARAAALAVTIT